MPVKNRTGLTGGGDLGSGVIWKQILSFFFPVLLGSVFQQLYNTVDTVVVGRFVGKEALAAVGVCATPINLFVGFFTGLAAGATVYIAQQYGAGNKRELDHAIHTALFMGVVFSVMFTVLGYYFSGPILRLVNTEDEIFADALMYMRVYFCGMSAVVFFNIGSFIFQAMGNSRFPMIVLIICCVTNIVGDLVLVAVLGWGVFGAAVATVFSLAVSAVVVITALLRSGEMEFAFAKLSPRGSHLPTMLRLGIPTGIQSVLYSVSNLIVLSNINTFGTNMTAAYTAYEKLDSIYWLVSNAFGIAITTFVGHNYGAEKFERAHKGVRTCLLMDLTATAAISAFSLVFGPRIMTIFTADAQVLENCRQFIWLVVPYYFTFIIVEIIGGGMRGAGKTIVPMVFTASGVCLLRMVWLLAVAPLNHTLGMVMFCYPLSWTVTSLMFLLYTRGGRRLTVDEA